MSQAIFIENPQYLIVGDTVKTTGGKAFRLTYHFDKSYLAWLIDKFEVIHTGDFTDFDWSTGNYFSAAAIPLFMHEGRLVNVTKVDPVLAPADVPTALSAQANEQLVATNMEKSRILKIAQAIISYQVNK
jgi:hypothetical protein